MVDPTLELKYRQNLNLPLSSHYHSLLKADNRSLLFCYITLMFVVLHFIKKEEKWSKCPLCPSISGSKHFLPTQFRYILSVCQTLYTKPPISTNTSILLATRLLGHTISRWSMAKGRSWNLPASLRQPSIMYRKMLRSTPSVIQITSSRKSLWALVVRNCKETCRKRKRRPYQESSYAANGVEFEEDRHAGRRVDSLPNAFELNLITDNARRWGIWRLHSEKQLATVAPRIGMDMRSKILPALT